MSLTIPNLYTEHEVAEVIGIHFNTVRKLRLSGQLRCTRLGRLIRYTQADIDDYFSRASDRAAPDLKAVDTKR